MAQNNFVDFDQAKALANKIAQRFNEQSAGLIFKGSKTFATLPSTLTQAMAGYFYNMSESFTTDSRFVEGSGKTYPAGTNVSVADCSTYEAVADPSGDPSSQDWYELVNNKYVLSTDTEVDPSKTYYVGNISMKFDVASGFIDVESINGRIDDVRDDVAEQFSTSGIYKAGDIVMHNDLLYKFKTDHSAGAWNSAEVDATNIASELSENQNVLTEGDYIAIDDGEIAVNRYAIPAGDIVYKVLTGDYNSGNTVYVDKYESNGTFIERVTVNPSIYQAQEVEGKIRFYKEHDRWEISLLVACKEQSAGYNYTVRPHNAVTENDFTFTVEQQLDDADLMTRGDVQDVTGDLSNLTTTAKTNLVAAINEVNASSSLTAGDYIEIDGNEISVNPVVPNEEATYQIVSDGQEGGTYFVRINKIVDGEVVLTERYSTVDNVKRTFDDTIRIDYANTVGWNFTYELLVASTTHDAGYTYSWGYSAQVDIDEVVVTADHSGESLVLKSQMDTALTGKQNTLTFDDTPTQNSTNPVKSGGVYSALSEKQDVFTSGDYLEMANGVLNVTKNKGNDLYSYKFITTSTSDQPRVKIQRYINGVFQSEEIYNNDNVRVNPVTLDGLFTFTYGVDGYRWQYTLLANSHQHNVGEVVKWMYNVSVDSTESFDVVPQDTSKNLVLQEDLDAAISSAYHHAGTKTCAELVAGLLVSGNEGNVYNMTDSGTTTADFIEGAGQPIKAGDNVGIAKISDGVYKFDLLSGFVDTTNFVQKSETAGLLKNDGTVDTTIQGDVSSLKSGLTTLNTEVNGDTTYPYADVITIEDAVPANLADCKVKIEPAQDLHGYDKPWVGGAGKNKLPLILADIKSSNTEGTWTGNAYSKNSVTFTVRTDADGNVIGIDLSGTASAQVAFILAGNIPMSAGSYIINGLPSGLSQWSIWLNAYNLTTSTNNNDLGSGKEFTVADNDVIEPALYIGANVDTTDKSIYPMIRLATETDATFAPYTNYCPITGHTEVEIWDVGENFFDNLTKDTSKGYIDSYYLTSNGSTAQSGGYYVSEYLEIKPNTAYYIGGILGNAPALCYYDDNKTYISGVQYANQESITDTSPSNAKYMRLSVLKANESLYMVRYAAAIVNVTIAFGDTIYGGTVDFDSGVMTVDRAIVDLGSLTYTYDYQYARFTSYTISAMKADEPRTLPLTCECYEVIDDGRPIQNVPDSSIYNRSGSGGVHIQDSRYTDPTDLATALDGMQLVYPLATPFTVQLTPTQIQLLKGQNTLTASTGQISVTVNGVSGAIGQVQEQVNDHEERIETVESGLTNLQNKNTVRKSYFINGKWYKIGSYSINALRWLDHRFIMAYNGTTIKAIRLRSNLTDGFNNNETTVDVIYGVATTFGIKLSQDGLIADLYINAGSLRGNKLYQLLTEGGEDPAVTFIEPIETDLTNDDMDVIG